jgi:hypothetical protein
MRKYLLLLVVFVSIISIGAYEIKPQGFITVNDGQNRFLVFHSKMIEKHYNLTTYSNNWKISASIDEPMPVGTKCFINVSTKKGTSLGIVDLSDGTPKWVVVGNCKAVEIGQIVTCKVISGSQLGRTVTLNLREW